MSLDGGVPLDKVAREGNFKMQKNEWRPVGKSGTDSWCRPCKCKVPELGATKAKGSQCDEPGL